MLRHKWLNSTQVAVQVSDHLQNTMPGLGRAVNKIPFQERRNIASYRYEREYRDEAGRWWVIGVTFRPNG